MAGSSSSDDDVPLAKRGGASKAATVSSSALSLEDAVRDVTAVATAIAQQYSPQPYVHEYADLTRSTTCAPTPGAKPRRRLVGRSRILAQDVIAKRPMPATKTSIRDGYAVASSQGTKVRRLTDVRSYAARGEEFAHAANASIQPDETAYVATGAPMPKGADAVVMQEKASELNLGGSKHIKLFAAPTPNMNVRGTGSDFNASDVLLRRGELLDSHAVLTCCAAGYAKVTVHSMLTVWVMSTGNELVDPVADDNSAAAAAAAAKGRPRKSNGNAQRDGNDDGCVYDANRPAIVNLLIHECCEVLDAGIVPDDQRALMDIIKQAYDSDDVGLVVTTGGASVGERDHVRAAVEAVGSKRGGWECGGTSQIWRFEKVHMKPGKPTGFATLSRGSEKRPLLVLSLPGNPASAMTTAHLLAIPCVRALARRAAWCIHHPRAQVYLGGDVKLDAERPEYMRATLRAATSSEAAHSGIPEGAFVADVTGRQVSSRPQSMVRAAALLELPPAERDVTSMPAGTRVTALLLAAPAFAEGSEQPPSTATMSARDVVKRSSGVGSGHVECAPSRSTVVPFAAIVCIGDALGDSKGFEWWLDSCATVAARTLKANGMKNVLKMGVLMRSPSDAADDLLAELRTLERIRACRLVVVIGPCSLGRTNGTPLSRTALASDAVSSACGRCELKAVSRSMRQAIREATGNPNAASLSQAGVYVFRESPESDQPPIWVCALEEKEETIKAALGNLLNIM
ncbi:molybdopterin molybdotransferase [Pseudoscourfieldia marina]